MTSLRGPGERNFNAVSHKPTRPPIQFNSICSRVSFGLWDTALKFLSPGPRNDVTDHLAANRGTSQNAFASYTVGLGFSGEYQGGTEFTRPRSCRASKKSIFRAALCWVTYLFCARLVKPARTWATLSGPYYIAFTSPHPSYLCASSGRHTASRQPLVGNNCS